MYKHTKCIYLDSHQEGTSLKTRYANIRIRMQMSPPNESRSILMVLIRVDYTLESIDRGLYDLWPCSSPGEPN